MLEIKNVVKVYKNGKASERKALKGVSFTLPDAGMVFILGKSGCGKSTLLNVLGGLDGFDGGDVVVDGKSLKDFSAKDYDTYRNNFVGFVFQENNLLEQYTVTRNVGLALELQKAEQDTARISDVLKQVGLSEYSEDKCNRLSGGQKQRVAIARAIIKKPEILLCDEPTGSLDSETGRDIFELLKEISKNTLVVVVSHDRESAEKYGDRIIELKDGSVISDSAPVSAENVNYKESKKLKSRGLPAKRAISLGAGYLLAHPVRLLLCLIICLITFTGVGIADSFAAFDRDKAVAVNTRRLKNSHLSFAYVGGSEYDDHTNLLEQTKFNIDNAGFEKFKSLSKANRYDKFYSFKYLLRDNYYDSVSFREINDSTILDTTTYFSCRGFVEMDEKFAEDYGLELYGNYPQAMDEVVISKHVFKALELCGYKRDEKVDDYSYTEVVYDINSYDDILGKPLTLTLYEKFKGDIKKEFKIVGVIDTKLNDVYGNAIYAKDYSTMPGIGVDLTVQRSMHSALFMCEGFYEETYIPWAMINDKELTAENIAAIKNVFVPLPDSDSVLLDYTKIYRKYKNNVTVDKVTGDISFETFALMNDAAIGVDFLEDIVRGDAKLLMWISIAATVLSVLFVLYYESVLVADKKREVGILRSLGASRMDIAKIFGIENGILIVAMILISGIAATLGVFFINPKLGEHYSLNLKLLTFGIRQISLLFAVAISAVLAGISFPIAKLLRAKPVDIIAGRK